MKQINTSGSTFKQFVSTLKEQYEVVEILSFEDSLQINGKPINESMTCHIIEDSFVQQIPDTASVSVGGFIRLGKEKDPFILQSTFQRWQVGKPLPQLNSVLSTEV